MFAFSLRALTRALRRGVLIGCVWFPIGTAGAWQLPPRHLLRRSAEALRGAREVQAYQVALVGRLRGDPASDSWTSVGARWVFSRIRHAASMALQASGEKSRTWVRGGAEMPGAVTVAEQVVLPRLFADLDPAGLAQQLGVDLGKQRLTLLGDAVADVIGSLPHERAGSELWLDHDSRLPLRVAFRPAGGPPVRIDLLDWSAWPDGIPFPREIVVYEAGRQVRTFEVEPARRMGP